MAAGAIAETSAGGSPFGAAVAGVVDDDWRHSLNEQD